MENLNEIRVKELRSDNETEFRNRKLKEFYDEKGISKNLSSPCTSEQNGIAERRNRTLIEEAKTMLNSTNIHKQFWGDDVNNACYTQNRSIIVKKHRKTTYDVFRGRSPDISYFYVFGCHVHIHSHRDHLGKFDEKADDGLFLGYSPMAKAFRVFNIIRQEMEETYHVTFSEDDEAISKSSTEGDEVNFNENRSFPYDEFIIPMNKVPQSSGNNDYFLYVLNSPGEIPELTTPDAILKLTIVDDNNILDEHDDFESVEDLGLDEDQAPTIIKPINKAKPSPTINSPSAGVTTRSKIRDSEATSAHECLYVNFLFEIEPKKVIEALEEEGWIIAILEAIKIFLAYAAYMGFREYQMDMKSAFLNGKISKEVYVQQPPGFESSEFPNHVCKLDKALYGLKQAPKAWYETLSTLFIQHKKFRDPMDEGGSALKMPNLNQFNTSEEGKLTLDDVKAQMQEMQRLAFLIKEKEKIKNKADQFLITKISYMINNHTKEETMTIERNNQPLSLILYEKFMLKTLGFSEWIEIHVMASKNKTKANDVLLKNLKAKFKWIMSQAEKLGIPPPLELSAFGLSATEKKRKKAQRSPRKESEFHLATTTQLIRLQNDIQRDTPEGEEMFKKIELTIEARNDVAEARKTVKENLDGLGQHIIEGLAECKASVSNLRRIQVKDIVKEVEDYLKTYSSSGMDISWLRLFSIGSDRDFSCS
ncbi:retrovirus-related pol polyprotein from transposon TNT 1-94 [Tanacetum coccineum]|uniref:Retrovirus-related pol polyprotein from transposon TNT 1-94 n=1 Tax=Tanacetum coccineum TaxID=301880 RepID=A0ABQ4XLH3_9ASTR